MTNYTIPKCGEVFSPFGPRPAFDATTALDNARGVQTGDPDFVRKLRGELANIARESGLTTNVTITKMIDDVFELAKRNGESRNRAAIKHLMKRELKAWQERMEIEPMSNPAQTELTQPTVTDPDANEKTALGTPIPFAKSDKLRKRFWVGANEILADMPAKDRDGYVHRILEVEHLAELPITMTVPEALQKIEAAYKAVSKVARLDENGKVQVVDKPAVAPAWQDDPAKRGAFCDALNAWMIDNQITFNTDTVIEKATGATIDAWPGKASKLMETIKAYWANPPITKSEVIAPIEPIKPARSIDQPVPMQRSIQPVLPEQARWDLMRQQAEILLKSGFLPQSIKTPEQALTIMMMGEAINVLPIVALNNINVINGKPTVAPQLMLGLIRRSLQLESLEVTDDGNACTVKMKRKNEPLHTEQFSQEHASALGLSGKDNWKKQPAVMRKWRAISAACRVVFPDVIWGMYTHEEIAPDGIYNEAGELIA